MAWTTRGKLIEAYLATLSKEELEEALKENQGPTVKGLVERIHRLFGRYPSDNI